MKKIILTSSIILVGAWYIFRPINVPQTSVIVQVKQTMKLVSSALINEETIPRAFTCDGQGEHPPFSLSGVPEGTKSLAVIVDDPDAPAGTFNHWVIWNIDPKATEIAAGQIPVKSQEGTNSSGSIGYTPPCPPAGPSHRYFFTLYALDSTIGLDGKAKKDELVAAMSGHIIEQTNLIGNYGR